MQSIAHKRQKGCCLFLELVPCWAYRGGLARVRSAVGGQRPARAVSTGGQEVVESMHWQGRPSRLPTAELLPKRSFSLTHTDKHALCFNCRRIIKLFIIIEFYEFSSLDFD